jgi:hypothetical protein
MTNRPLVNLIALDDVAGFKQTNCSLKPLSHAFKFVNFP